MDKKRVIEVLDHAQCEIRSLHKRLGIMTSNALVEVDRLHDELKGLRREKTKEEREKEFYDKLVPFVGKYGKDVVRSFYEHWVEWNDSGTKMAWEIAKKKKGTFNISGRLATWKKRDELFKPKGFQNTEDTSETASSPRNYSPV